MKSYVFCGDTHGDLDFVESATKLARQHDAELVSMDLMNRRSRSRRRHACPVPK